MKIIMVEAVTGNKKFSETTCEIEVHGALIIKIRKATLIYRTTKTSVFFSRDGRESRS